ncbi:MAG: SRPBCC family protein [Gammaproteobacteria bacterium]|nr:SRPBCC family protein [Gammaproteobacteria bacterium]
MKLTHSIEINAAPSLVFAWIKDPQRAIQWQTSVASGEIIKQTPWQVGTTFRETIEENGQSTELFGEITEFIPNQLIAFHLEGKFNVVDVSFRVEATRSGSRVTQQADLRFKGLVRLMSLFFRRTFRRKLAVQSQQEFARLKALCEEDVESMKEVG